jgi:hypothetical protein
MAMGVLLVTGAFERLNNLISRLFA